MSRKTVMALIIVFVLIGGIVVYLGSVQNKSTDIYITGSSEASRTFVELLQAATIEKTGQPLEGLEAEMLLESAVGLLPSDFDGVETSEGHYTVEGGILSFQRDYEMPVTSAERALSEDGYETLFRNVVNRLGVTTETSEEAKELVSHLFEEVSEQETNPTVPIQAFVTPAPVTIEPPEPIPAPDPEPGPSCTDTDGGSKYGKKGTVTYCIADDSNCLSSTDVCTDDSTLREYYCQALSLQSRLVTCENYCGDGACVPPPSPPVIPWDEEPLVAESRDIIITYGFSESYFDDHFEVSDYSELNLGSIRWKFTIGEFTGFVYDSIGKNSKGVVHSIGPSLNTELPTLEDINNVISKSEADALMASCIPDVESTRVELSFDGNPLTGAPGLFYIGTGNEQCPQCDESFCSDISCVFDTGVINIEDGSVVKCQVY